MILLCALAFADDPAPWEKTGFGFGGLPAVNYNTDEGLGAGAIASLYRYDGASNPYRWALTTTFFMTTLGVHSHSLELDALQLTGKPIRLLTRVELQATRTANYCGTDPSAADCDPAEAESAADARGLTGATRVEFVRHYYQARFVLSQLRVEGRWALDPMPHQLSVFGLVKVNTLLPGDFSTPAPYTGSRYDLDFRGGEDGETSVISVGAMLDDRDFEPAPTRGYWIEASARGASRFWGSDWEYFGLNTTLRGYLPLGTPRLVLADRIVLDGIWGEANTYELGQSGGSQRYAYYGSLNAGRGVRLQRFIGEVKAMEQLEVRATVWSPSVGRVPLDFTVLAFSDNAFIAQDFQHLDHAALVPGLGGGLRIAFDGNFVLRGDVGVSPAEDWSPGVYLDIRNTY